MDELEVCKRLALVAGRRIMELRTAGYSVQEKVDLSGRKSPVTSADLEADRIIVSGLREAFPTYGILSEEEGDDLSRLGKEHVFIIDPLDGTKEFISGNDDFTVNIGLAYLGRPVMGVVYAPAYGELYYAREGAYREKDGEKIRLTVTDVSERMKAVVSRSNKPQEHRKRLLMAGVTDVTLMGGSRKGCLVASGEKEMYLRITPQDEWDICAMHAIIRMAGGKMTLLSGEEITYNNKETKIEGFLASNGVKHEEMCERMRVGE